MTGDKSTFKPLHPAFTINNIKILVPITLDLKDDEYALWVYLFQLHLEAQNLMFIVQGTESPSGIDCATLKQLDALVRQWMFATMSKDLMLTVLKSGHTAKAIWDHLKTLFQDNKGTGAATLEKNSLTTSVEELASAGPACSSADESEMKRIHENSLTTSVVSVSAAPACSSADESEMKRIHDNVENYIRRCYDAGKLNDMINKVKNGKGIFEDNVRAVIQAKVTVRERGLTETDYFSTLYYAEELQSSSSLTAEGLTCRDVSNIERYLKKGMPKEVTDDTLSSVVATKSIYARYIIALSSPGGYSTIKVLEKIKEGGVSLKNLAIFATETSYSDVPDLRRG